MKELGLQFAEVEQRVRALLEENTRLRERVRELEKEQVKLGEATRETDVLRAKRMQVQDRLKRLLHMLESVEINSTDKRDPEQASS